MPIYEYACPTCRKSFEEWLKADDQAQSHPCPQCGQAAPRILSHTSFQLKGGGWYVSDYGYKKGVNEDGSAGSAVSGSAAAAPSAAAGTEASAPKAEAAPAPTPAPAPAAAKTEAAPAKAVASPQANA